MKNQAFIFLGKNSHMTIFDGYIVNKASLYFHDNS